MPPIIPYSQELPSEGAENEINNELHPSYFVSDSDSLSEDEDHDGYQPLSQDPDNCIDNSSDLEEDSNFLNEDDAIVSEVSLVHHHSAVLPALSFEPTTSNQQAEAKKDLKMDEEHIERIKSVMKNITLPRSNLPQWATFVPEEEWKSVVLSEMLAKKKESNIQSSLGGNSTKDDCDYATDIPR